MAPILATFAVVIAMLVLIVWNMGKAPELNEKWAHISTIFLSLPIIFFSLLSLGVVILLTWLLWKIYKFIPANTGRFYQAVDQANRITNRATEKGLSPLIQGRAYFAGFKRLLSMAFHISNNREE